MSSCFSFHLFSFLLQNHRTEWWNKSCPVGRAGTSGRGEVLGKGGRRANTVQKMCTHVNKCKNDTIGKKSMQPYLKNN
jgi:hypothetical protein